MRFFNGYAYDKMSPAWLKQLIRQNESKWINFSDEEVIRWIYIELGKRFSMSEKYRYAITKEEKAAIERAARDSVIRPSRINNPSQVICIDIAETLSSILSEVFGIRASVMLDGSGPHVYVEARTDNYGRIKLDLQEDLYNIKTGRRTEHFASESSYDGRRFMTIPKDQIEEIDKKLEYIGEDAQYMDDILEQFRSRIESSKDSDERIRKIFILLEAKFEVLKGMGYCERTQLYKKVIQDMMPDDNVHHRTFRVKKQLVSCFRCTNDNGEEMYYEYSKDKHSYQSIDTERYQALCQEDEQAMSEAISVGR